MASLCGWLLSSVAVADHYPEVMFILDSSGSMAEVVAGKSKIDAAKEVMHQVVPELDENIRVGLTAYGHRRPGDCSDIEVLIPAGSNDRSKLLSQVDRLRPRGRTPISASILSVASMLKTKDAETTIILVSDGIETCGGDPCEVVAQLKKTGVKFILHVVGFHVNAAAAQQLECAAGAGGGQYFAAEDGAQLLEALKAVSSEVLAKVQKVDPAVVHSQKHNSGLGKLRVTMPIGSEVSLKHFNIRKADSDEITRSVDSPNPDATYPLLSGTYAVSLGFATPSYGQATEAKMGAVTIVKGGTHELRLGSISFNIPEKLADNLSVQEVLIADAGTDNIVVTVRKNGNSYYHYKPKPIVAGVYDVLFNYSLAEDGMPSTVAANVVVEPGTDTVVTLDSGIQLKEAEGVVGWELIPVESRTANPTEDGKAGTTVRPILRFPTGGSGNNDRLWLPYIVPAGTYNLNVFIEGMKESLPVGEGIVIQTGRLVQFDSGL